MRKVTISIPIPEFGIRKLVDSVRSLGGMFSHRGDYERREVPFGTLEVEQVARIAYPKGLSNPDADPDLIIEDALKKFLEFLGKKSNFPITLIERNNSFMLQYVRCPPIEHRKIEDFVRYEMKQRIPFELIDVESRWQVVHEKSSAGAFEECEVLLSAIKKDAVARALSHFRRLKVERWVDSVQPELLPLLEILNCTTQRGERVAVLEVHSDYSNLVVYDGESVWQRGIPIGGNHFTRQLCKDLKLTFAKAEHLKLNAMQADDPKLVFGAMRPVFDDLVTEVQRSLNFYRTLNSEKTISHFLLAGNATMIPGFELFLQKNIGLEFRKLPKIEIGISESVSSVLWETEYDNFAIPTLAAIQRLGFGMFRENFAPNGKPFAPKAKVAWGLNIGNQGLTAVKVRVIPKSKR